LLVSESMLKDFQKGKTLSSIQRRVTQLSFKKRIEVLERLNLDLRRHAYFPV
jgi:hypothetical protein